MHGAVFKYIHANAYNHIIRKFYFLNITIVIDYELSVKHTKCLMLHK